VAAEPGDDHAAFDSFGDFPFYSVISSDDVKGSLAPSGVAVHAYPFKAEYSGPIEYVSVSVDPEAGYDASVRVFIATDVGNRPGVRIAEFPMEDIPGNPSFRFAYHNYSNLAPDETTYSIVKGQTYWIGMEPLTERTYVRWLSSIRPNQVKGYHDDASAVATGKYIRRGFYTGFKINVFEPYPPEVASPGVPLVEAIQVPDEPVGVKLSSLGNVPQAPSRGTLDSGRMPVILGADGKVKLRAFAPAPGLAVTEIVKLDEPSGDIVLATSSWRRSSGRARLPSSPRQMMSCSSAACRLRRCASSLARAKQSQAVVVR
jgi:hypothetical protein